MELVLGLLLASVIGCLAVIYGNGKERVDLNAQILMERDRNQELVETIIRMRREGFTPAPKEEPLEMWALDNEHEAEVEAERQQKNQISELGDMVKGF